MSTELEQQISNYFGWVEAEAGVSMRPSVGEIGDAARRVGDGVEPSPTNAIEFRGAATPSGGADGRRPWLWLAVAAASVALVGGLAVLVSDDQSDPPSSSDTPAAAPAYDDVTLSIPDDAAMSVVVRPDATAAELDAIRERLEQADLVTGWTYRDPDASLSEAEVALAGEPDVLAELAENGVPTAFRLTVRPNASESDLVELAESLTDVPGLFAITIADDPEQRVWSPSPWSSAPSTFHTLDLRGADVSPNGLPAIDPSLLPTVPTPSIEGWTIEVTRVDLRSRYSDAGQMVGYRLRASGSELGLLVSSGASSLDDERVTLELLDGPVEGALRRGDDDEFILTWNNTTGASAGTTTSLFGPSEVQLIEVAERLSFEARPLTGASAPRFVDVPFDSRLPIAGTIDGVEWRLFDGPGDRIHIAIDGNAPEIASSMSTPGAVEVDLTTVSFDGNQVSAIVVPPETPSVSVAFADGDRAPLLMVDSPTTGRRVAVLVVPAGRDAGIIAVAQPDGTETLLGLPVVPPDGWSTSRFQLQPG